MELLDVMARRVRKALTKMGCGLCCGEGGQLQPQRARRRVQKILSMATTQNHEPSAFRQRLPKQVACERPRLAVVLGRLLCVVRGIDHDAEHRAGVGAANQRDGLSETGQESPNVGRGFCVSRGQQRMAKRHCGEFISNLDQRFLMTMPRTRHVAVPAVAVAVVEDRDGPRWQAGLNSRREYRLSDARQGVDDDGASFRLDDFLNQIRFLLPDDHIIGVRYQAWSRV